MGNKFNRKKYSIMSLNRASSIGFLLLGCLLLLSPVQADELKDIHQLASRGQGAAALKRIDSYISAHPQDVQAQFMKGVILAEQGKRDDAIKTFSELTQKYPNLPEPYNNLAVLYADRGEYDKAKAALEIAIKTHPSYATAHENLGDIYARMASEAYDKALQLDGGNTRAQNKLSLITELLPATSKPTTLAQTAEPAKETPKPANVLTPSAAKPAMPAKTETKPVTPANSEETTQAATPAKPEPQKPAASKPAADPSKAITTAVKEWAKAWSSQNVQRYLASYADNFQAPGGDRKAWEETRRQRVGSPEKIRVDISNLRVKLEGDDTAKASFRQSYRTGRTSLRTDKTLIMKKVGDDWLIEQELTDR